MREWGGRMLPDQQQRFELRFSCSYDGADHEVGSFKAERRTEKGWEEFLLDHQTQGFWAFVYSILSCQLQSLQIHAQRYGLEMARSVCNIRLTTDANWVMQSLQTHFRIRLRTGEPDADDVDEILTGMQSCPVSNNIKDVVSSETLLEFEIDD